MIYSIKSGLLEVSVDDYGAELISVRFQGKEMLWQNDNGSWAGHAPVMFPACGSCDIVVDGKKYPHFLHGFARKNTFSVAEQTGDSITFLLSSSEATKALYPFDFRFLLTYKVQDDTLIITHKAENTGDKTMYCAFGAHESYVLEKTLDNYRLVFEKTEKLDSLIHNKNGVLTGEIQAFGVSDTLPLPVAFLENSNTAIFGGIQSNSVVLESLEGKKVATVGLQGFDNLLLWHSEGSQMICIEPWQNLPDYADKTDVELCKKKGINAVKAGETYTLVRTVRYH